jgi:uncharacterized protein
MEDYLEVFREQNPWHLTATVPEIWAPHVERPLAKSLWKRLLADEPRRFQLVLGPRRVGKTTSLYQAVRGLLAKGILPTRLWWLRLDHPILMLNQLGTLVKHLVQTAKATAASPIYLFLDELTYSDKWDLWLKTFYDENWPVRIAGSSSSTAALRDRRMESGVGRWDEQYLAPYLFSEALDLLGDRPDIPVQNSLYETIMACLEQGVNIEGLEIQRRKFVLTGGFPELLISSKGANDDDEVTALLKSQRILRSDAIERSIYKDIPQVFGVDNPMLLERLLYTLAGQVAGLLSPHSICQNLDGLSQPTFDRYLSYLEKAFLVFTLSNYSGAEASVQKRGRKLYFVDAAVRNAALQRGISPLRDETEMRLLLENLAASHLHALSQQNLVRLYHWRDKDDEVDLIYDHPEYPMAFEIATGAKHHRSGLWTFASRYKKFKGRCFVVSPAFKSGKLPQDSLGEVASVPLETFLLAVSAQAEKELEKNLTSSAANAIVR